MEIKDIVRKLIKKYKTSDPYELANYLNIIVLIDNLDESIRGYFHYFKRNKIIHINSKLSDKDKRIVLAHELGHAILHPRLNIIFMERNTYFIKSKYEYEANKFAAELLIDDDDLKVMYNETIGSIAGTLGVNEELVAYKLNKIHI
ncbi:putative Zn peptidase [Thermoanaerobacter thermohydrosulfuricus WC1]|uniref:Putative Zn peptidase n=1 Tax=Thermoanaerobacter thermohydrosulfuricus WC1 TaxID=1198630 RepID=M8CV35_THETY|nr:ImmA/IrrE family metallo-endopeptidase [Thermoanaerobacter thermohydrosulfuricus]EMT38213.1 putative Zn peptidase [Thermoanaerobacter thermohydrosulfuricus WC1]